MTKIRAQSFSISLDGYGAGPAQSLEHPLGVGGERLHDWAFATRTFQQRVMHDDGAGETGVDDDFIARGFANVGAWVLGRNMFGPVRGPWPDDSWRGWWGDEPPYHTPVMVLTHYARPSLEMEGGTVFHFVTEGLAAAIDRARAAAGPDRDVRIGGGVSTVRQCLQARLVDEAHLAVAPTLLGRGEHLFHGLDLRALGYRVAAHAATARATHIVLERA
jgi:dihydrofolate reductase